MGFWADLRTTFLVFGLARDLFFALDFAGEALRAAGLRAAGLRAEAFDFAAA